MELTSPIHPWDLCPGEQVLVRRIHRTVSRSNAVAVGAMTINDAAFDGLTACRLVGSATKGLASRQREPLPFIKPPPRNVTQPGAPVNAPLPPRIARDNSPGRDASRASEAAYQRPPAYSHGVGEME